MPSSQPDYDFIPGDNDELAQLRADQFRNLDPFPSIPKTLLSSAEIEDYARVTAMLHPFYPNRDFLKSASYEVRPGRRFVRWDEKGNRLQELVRRGGKYILPANSIGFMQIEPRIRLPDYIAIRFNLRIKWVHRGLLLGTGPLVDPGFAGDLVIPLHNLTSDPCEIDGDEGLIWVEFTKTSLEVPRADPEYVRRGAFRAIEQRKTHVPLETYFERATRNNPVRSSIPDAIKQSESRAIEALTSAQQSRVAAQEAAQSARAAQTIAHRQTLFFSGISIFVILGGVLGFHQYLAQIEANVETTLSLAGTVNSNADQAKFDAARALTDAQQIRDDLAATNRQLGKLSAQDSDLEKMRTDLGQLKERIETLGKQLEATTRERASPQRSRSQEGQSRK